MSNELLRFATQKLHQEAHAFQPLFRHSSFISVRDAFDVPLAPLGGNPFIGPDVPAPPARSPFAYSHEPLPPVRDVYRVPLNPVAISPFNVGLSTIICVSNCFCFCSHYLVFDSGAISFSLPLNKHYTLICFICPKHGDTVSYSITRKK